MNYLMLAVEFAKIGLFSIGGGLAALPFLYQIAGKFSWLSADDIPQMLAVVQLLPGAIGVNMAAYTGFHLSTAGLYIAVLSMITPQIITITLIASMFERFNKSAFMQRIFCGLNPAAAGLLCAAAFNVIMPSIFNSDVENGLHYIKIKEAVVFTAFFLAVRVFKKAHPGLFIASAGIIGAALGL